jgi:nicotinate dehydrogenase subunit A
MRHEMPLRRCGTPVTSISPATGVPGLQRTTSLRFLLRRARDMKALDARSWKNRMLPTTAICAEFREGIAMAVSLNVNGAARSVPAEPDTPLLYVLRNDFELNGAKFGCGLAQCGACTVLIDGKAVRSCVTPIGTVTSSQITTLEGIIGEQAAQCGYCISGMIMSAKALLDANPKPTETDVRQALATNLCRCGTHNRIVSAVMRAAQEAGRT